MTEDAFNGVLTMIIDAHREADRNRRLWARIWVILALSITVLVGAGWYSLAQAQTAVPAYEGGALAWDYPANVPNHAGFLLTVDGVTGNTQIGKDVRQILLSNTTLKAQPFGKTYTLKLVAVAASPAVNSVPATIMIDYQARPRLAPPTNTRTILEWQP